MVVNRIAVTVPPSFGIVFVRFSILSGRVVDFEGNISEFLEYPLNDLLRISSSSVELAKARLRCGTNFSFHISGFVVKLTNPHSAESPPPPKQQE